MNIASYVHSLINNWSKAISRFPLFIIGCVIVCSYFSYLQIDNKSSKDFIIMPLFIGMGSLFLASLTIETYSFAGMKKILSYLVAFGIAILYSIILPHKENHILQWPEITFVSLILVFHLAYAIIPFLKNRSEEAFLRYNVFVLEIFVESALLCIILFALLNLALYALKTLFGLPYEYSSIAHLFIWITGLVHSVNFLSVFPTLPVHEDSIHKYTSRFYKILVLYISIPVMIIYAIIVMAYIVKLSIGGTYQPWITTMCGWYIGIGLAVFLLNRLYQKDNQSELANFYNKYFALSSLPIVLLFIYCTYTNIIDEGLNTANYYSTLMSVASMLIFGGLIAPKKFDLIWIPSIVLALTLFSIFSGPLNVWTFPWKAQKTRLVNQLQKVGAIKNGTLNFDSKLDSLMSIEIESSINTLQYNADLQFLKAYDKNKLLPDTIQSYMLIEKLSLFKPLNSNPMKSKYYEYLPVIEIDQAILYPILNKYVNTSDKFSGLKISGAGNIFIYENNEISDSLIVAMEAIDQQKLSLLSSVKKDTFEIYVTNLTYQANSERCTIEDLTGIALKK